MISEAHREALQKVLERDFVEHDVIVNHFNHIFANITSCNNLSFCDEELLEEGRNHNLALHISMNCKDDIISNVLVDTGSSLNVLPKLTLSRLSYQGAPMRYSGVIVKAFDDSRKTVIGEVNLPVKIGPSDFHITFQVELDRSRSRESHSRSGSLVSGHTRMALASTRMRWHGDGPYAYGTRQYAYGQDCDFPELLLCSF
ncbi:hypothetical protein KIW84_032429 [Lathyrus oleraceus]|uniref:Uncharacterized protein n=1 Tax=Pisum sativum TaxID=3888 RepID=A0A9D5B287_PEA|nr:hypothetical protein KIW84_032429 [Pisum sativum]